MVRLVVLLLAITSTAHAFQAPALAPPAYKQLSAGNRHVARARARNTVPKMMTEFETLTLAQAAATIVAAPSAAYSTLLGALEVNALAVDTSAASLLYVLGKVTSGAISQKSEPNQARFLANWAALGVMDGACTHSWYSCLQNMVEGLQADRLTEAVTMTLASSVLYTPVYCVGFLVMLSLLEGKGLNGAMQRARLDIKELFGKTTKVWGPTNLMLFGLVPPHLRTIVSMGIHYVFLVGLALWDAAKRDARDSDSSVSAAGPEHVDPMSANSMLNMRVATAFRAVDEELSLPMDSDLPSSASSVPDA